MAHSGLDNAITNGVIPRPRHTTQISPTLPVRKVPTAGGRLISFKDSASVPLLQDYVANLSPCRLLRLETGNINYRRS
jgi:hypothetical protein